MQIVSSCNRRKQRLMILGVYIGSGTLFFHARLFYYPTASPGDSDRFQWWNGVMNGRSPSPMLQQSKFWSNVTIDEMES